MTTATDYLESVLVSLASARQSIAALSTKPEDCTAAIGYTKACPNPADCIELGSAFLKVLDAIEEVESALAELRKGGDS